MENLWFSTSDYPADPYPGARPGVSFVALDRRAWVVSPAETTGWRVDGTSLDEWLAGHGALPVANRVPVLAYGSNACPGKLDWLREAMGLRGPVVVGYGGMQWQVDEAHITTLTVDGWAGRRGVGSRLLVELLREARARGAVSATLEVRTDNATARALYASFGFRPVGIRPRYYDGRDDALIMWAHDIGGADFGRLLRARADRGARP